MISANMEMGRVSVDLQCFSGQDRPLAAALKIEPALRVRQRFGAGIAWLARRLHLGTTDVPRCQLSLTRRNLINISRI